MSNPSGHIENLKMRVKPTRRYKSAFDRECPNGSICHAVTGKFDWPNVVLILRNPYDIWSMVAV
jgi:hypothetical protein